MTRVISARTGINGVSLAPSYVLNKHDDSFFFLLYFPGMRVRLFRNKGFNENAVPLFHFLSWSSSRTDLLQIICLFKDTSLNFLPFRVTKESQAHQGRKEDKDQRSFMTCLIKSNVNRFSFK